MSYPRIVKAEILKNFPLCKDIYALELSLSEELKPLPGQFLFLKIFQGFSESICKPFVFNSFNEKTVIVYKIVGEGTLALSKLKPGEILSAIAPLGKRPFSSNQDSILIASGVKSAAIAAIQSPELFFIEENEGEREILQYFKLKATILKTKEELFEAIKPKIDKRFSLSVPLELALELKSNFNIAGEIFMQARVACGWGACYGCAIETKSGYKRLCIDGPVFNLEDVYRVN